MNKKTVTSQKSKDVKKKRLLEAKREFQKIQKEIEPFIKRRNFKRHSTAGKWFQTSDFSV